jgi:cell volume regulation protein A
MVCRESNYFVPKGYTKLSPGDKLLVVSDNNEELKKKAKDLGIKKFIKV